MAVSLYGRADFRGSGTELGRGWEESALLVGQLRRLARDHLARFAYPRRVVFDDLPRNSSGKVDRSATRERFAEV